MRLFLACLWHKNSLFKKVSILLGHSVVVFYNIFLQLSCHWRSIMGFQTLSGQIFKKTHILISHDLNWGLCSELSMIFWNFHTKVQHSQSLHRNDVRPYMYTCSRCNLDWHILWISLLNLYSVSQENPNSDKNMTLLKDLQFLLNHYETLSKWGPYEYFILKRFLNDWVKLCIFC